jgi:hypothetical protein
MRDSVRALEAPEEPPGAADGPAAAPDPAR